MTDNTQPSSERAEEPTTGAQTATGSTASAPTASGATASGATAQQTSSGAYTAEGQRTSTAAQRQPARFGTILWGVLLLVFAGLMIAGQMLPFALDPVTWITGGLIAIGLVLVVAGIAAAFRRR